MGHRAGWPGTLWLLVLFAVPCAWVFVLMLRPADAFGGIEQGWTLDHVQRLLTDFHHTVWWRTIRLSALTTLICVGLGLPTALYLVRLKQRWRLWLLTLLVVPFWTSMLVRVFAWKALLHPAGWIKNCLVMLGLADAQSVLLYNEGAVLLVLVSVYLPFAVLPLYAACERFDFSLFEAAIDLGASRWLAVRRVLIPGIARGLGVAALLVFVPALGSFVIPDLVGGTDGDMVGNLIARHVYAERNLPRAAALSALLMLVVLVPAWLFVRRRADEGGRS